jgi:hypothetical protein
VLTDCSICISLSKNIASSSADLTLSGLQRGLVMDPPGKLNFNSKVGNSFVRYMVRAA